MKKTRRKIDAALKAKIALEALREQANCCRPGAALSGSPQPDLRLTMRLAVLFLTLLGESR